MKALKFYFTIFITVSAVFPFPCLITTSFANVWKV